MDVAVNRLKWQVENHGVDVALMDKVKQLVYSHYDSCLKESFYSSELARGLGPQTNASDVDWESTYFLHHHPESNTKTMADHGAEFRLISFLVGFLAVFDLQELAFQTSVKLAVKSWMPMQVN